jgi:hypothetical protein
MLLQLMDKLGDGTLDSKSCEYDETVLRLENGHGNTWDSEWNQVSWIEEMKNQNKWETTMADLWTAKAVSMMKQSWDWTTDTDTPENDEVKEEWVNKQWSKEMKEKWQA